MRATDQTAGLPIFDVHVSLPSGFGSIALKKSGGRVSVTSGEARGRVKPFLSGLRAKIYEAIREARADGMTRAQLALELHIKENTVNGRCAELIEAKLIVSKAVARRDHRSVLVAVEFMAPTSEIT